MVLRPLAVGTRLTLWYGAVLGLTIAILGVVVWLSVSAVLRASIDSALHVQAADVRSALARDSRVAVTTLDPGSPGVFTVVYGPKGEIRSHSRAVPVGLREPPPGRTTEETTADGASYAIVSEAATDSEVILVGTSLAGLQGQLDSLRWLLVGLGSTGFVASLVGGWILSNRALAPVKRLTREADAIGLTDLDRRLPEPPALDEIGRLARTLNGMLERVAAAVRRERFFISAASHDLRTPIASLRNELELAGRLPMDEQALREAIWVAHADAVQLSTLAADLLGLAEAETYGRSLALHPVTVDELIGAAVATVEPLAAERSVTIVVDATDAVIEVDRVRIEQALVNLLSNAIREGPPGSSVEVQATVATVATAGDPSPARAAAGRDAVTLSGLVAGPERRAGHMMISVLDRGPGVPEVLRPLLFVPFASRAKGRAGGTGLGLATAAAAARAHDGTIEYEDRAGGGATFRIRIPVDMLIGPAG